MARRSDHTRSELEALILAEGHSQMAEKGFARFSAREVAKQIGYSIGTIYNVMGSHDALIMAINGHTFSLWADYLRARLAQPNIDRIVALTTGYFDFARENRNLWMAIYDHRLPAGEAMPDWYTRKRMALTSIVEAEIARALPEVRRTETAALARSLVATVHGHCFFALNGTFEILGERHPLETTLARVRETLRAAGADI
jgi:AcrR family transcriptional regulator